MPTRLIRDGILTSERVTQLSWEAEVFYRRLLSVVDDYGLYDSRPSILRSALYPLQLDKMSECNIQRSLTACETAGLILLYSQDGKPFLMILHFGQALRSLPKYPLPDGYKAEPVSKNKYQLLTPLSNCKQPQTTANNCTQPFTNAYAYADSDSDANTDANTNTNTPDGVLHAPGKTSEVMPMPRSTQEVVDYMSNLHEKPGDSRSLEASAERFFDYYVIQGRPLHNWKSRAAIWAKDDAGKWAVQQKRDGYKPGTGKTGSRKNYNEYN